jgi:hypothetical protein
MKRHTPESRALGRSPASTTNSPSHRGPAFHEIIALIQQARQQTFRAVNVGLIDLYWGVGKRISRRGATDGSPALIAKSQTRLPDKKLPRRKPHGFYQLALPETETLEAKQRKGCKP